MANKSNKYLFMQTFEHKRLKTSLCLWLCASAKVEDKCLLKKQRLNCLHYLYRYSSELKGSPIMRKLWAIEKITENIKQLIV